MTTLGIQWLDRIENERHNIAVEAETQRSNQARELQAYNELQESIRHNTTVEEENLRHNQEMEAENLRSHLADEALRHEAYLENVRHNIMGESISHRQNLITAKFNEARITDMQELRMIKKTEANAKSMQAQASMSQAVTKNREMDIKQFSANTDRMVGISNIVRNTADAIAKIGPLVAAAFA